MPLNCIDLVALGNTFSERCSKNLSSRRKGFHMSEKINLDTKSFVLRHDGQRGHREPRKISPDSVPTETDHIQTRQTNRRDDPPMSFEAAETLALKIAQNVRNQVTGTLDAHAFGGDITGLLTLTS